MADPFPIRARCCGCGQVRSLRNVMMISRKAPEPGQGWGCAACGLPPDGALAVLCDPCIKKRDLEIRWVCAGRVTDPARMPIAECIGAHEHDMRKHPEVQAEGN